MSAWTDPETGNAIETVRFTDETFALLAHPMHGDLRLDDLRELVARTAHLPGDALLHISSIRVSHRVYHDTASAETDSAIDRLLGDDGVQS